MSQPVGFNRALAFTVAIDNLHKVVNTIATWEGQAKCFMPTITNAPAKKYFQQAITACHELQFAIFRLTRVPFDCYSIKIISQTTKLVTKDYCLSATPYEEEFLTQTTKMAMGLVKFTELVDIPAISSQQKSVFADLANQVRKVDILVSEFQQLYILEPTIDNTHIDELAASIEPEASKNIAASGMLTEDTTTANLTAVAASKDTTSQASAEDASKNASLPATDEAVTTVQPLNTAAKRRARRKRQKERVNDTETRNTDL